MNLFIRKIQVKMKLTRHEREIYKKGEKRRNWLGSVLRSVFCDMTEGLDWSYQVDQDYLIG